MSESLVFTAANLPFCCKRMAFFRNIGYADQLGSGVRNLFKYSKFYSGKEPEFREGDVFRIIVPLDEAYSFDYNTSAGKMPVNADKVPISADKCR